MLQIVEGRKPVIAKVHGAAFAAGCQLVASCDLAYSTKDAFLQHLV
jgi:enoyl-CoA hydratase/carnithine racemase